MKAPPSDLANRQKVYQHRSLKTVAVWGLTMLTSAMFIASAVPKLGGMGWFSERFKAWGYPGWFEFAIGITEFVGAIFLIVPGTAFYAALALGAVMLGAIFTHLALGEPFVALLPGMFLMFLGFIGWVRRPRALHRRWDDGFQSPRTSH